jgi:hypothetical protein
MCPTCFNIKHPPIESGRSAKLAFRLHLVGSRLRLRAAITPFPNTSSWYGTTLCFTRIAASPSSRLWIWNGWLPPASELTCSSFCCALYACPVRTTVKHSYCGLVRYSIMQTGTTLLPISVLYRNDRGTCTSEMLISSNQSTRCPDPEGHNINTWNCIVQFYT